MLKLRAVRLVLVLTGLLIQGAPALAAPEGFYPVAIITSGPAGDGQARATALLLGAWQSGRWQTPASAAPLLKTSRNWRMQALGAAGKAGTVLLRSGGVPLPGGDPCPETVFLDFPAAGLSGSLLVTAPALNVRPRPVESLPTQNAVYRELVRTALVGRGLRVPTVVVDSVTRTDLDGDGTSEVIIGASHFRSQTGGMFAPPPRAEAGDYSLLLLRWVKNGQVQTTVLAQNVFTTTPTQAQLEGGGGQVPTRFGLAGVADLNGDGRMELVVQDAYYEGEGAAVLEWSPVAGVKERLSEGCGA
ncbi:FG-GAP repeat domain-containing protein [Deinococcus altitudinis]|uniref:FG-GAP repeat domain-containing protein n=1 Tax=Deinococcus altitudinis TaxID=468914 RepID=UPI003892282F